VQNHRAYLCVNYIEPQLLLPVILGATFFSLGFLFVMILIGLPTFLLVALFIGAIFLAIYSFTYTGQFWLFDDRIEEKLTPKLSFSPFIKTRQNVYNLADLDSYIFDSEMTRYYGERKYLKLYFKSHRVISINEGNDADTRKHFAAFVAVMLDMINPSDTPTPAISEPLISTDNPAPIQNPEVVLQPLPKIQARLRKNFYKTFWGKAITIAFVVLTATLLLVAILPAVFGVSGLGFANNWRLWVILLPGTLYMVNRTFGKPNSP
jgi:hypothetical protein